MNGTLIYQTWPSTSSPSSPTQLVHSPLDTPMEPAAGVRELDARRIRLVAAAQRLKVGGRLGRHVVEELELEAAGGRAADRDVEVGYGVGHRELE